MNQKTFDDSGSTVYVLSRASLSSRKPGIDITVKSAKGKARMLAPTWEMVKGIKDGSLSEFDYTNQYLQILHQNEQEIVQYLLEVAHETGGVLRFLCYCKDGSFCHTYLLISWLYHLLQDRGKVVIIDGIREYMQPTFPLP